MNGLLDTTVFIDYYRKDPKAEKYLDEYEIVSSIVTIAELIQGARDKREQRNIEIITERARVLPLTPEIGEKMLSLMKQFAKSHGLRIPDALIAATAMEEDLVLVTANIKHFSFIKGLEVEDWKRV